MSFDGTTEQDLIDVARVTLWLEREIYPGLLHSPVDDIGVDKWVGYCYRRLRLLGLSHETALHHVFGHIEDVLAGRPEQPYPGGQQTVPVGPASPPTEPSAAPVTPRGTCFVQGNLQWKYHGCRMANLFSQYLAGQDISPFLSWARSLHVNTIQTYGSLSWAKPSILNPRTLGVSRWTQEVGGFCRHLNQEGFVLELTALADCRVLGLDASFQQRLLQEADGVLAGQAAMLECWNEAFKPDNTNGVDVDAVAPRTFHVPTSLGLYFVEGGSVNLPIRTTISVHPGRGTAWEKGGKEPLEYSVIGFPDHEAFGVPAYINEGMGGADADEPGRRSSDPQKFADFSGTAELFCCGSAIFLQSVGIEGILPTARQQRIAEAHSAMWTVVPTVAQLGTYAAGHLPECPVVHPRLADGTLDEAKRQRTYSMQDGDRAWVMLLRNTVPPVAASGWRIKAIGGVNGNFVTMERT